MPRKGDCKRLLCAQNPGVWCTIFVLVFDEKYILSRWSTRNIPKRGGTRPDMVYPESSCVEVRNPIGLIWSQMCSRSGVPYSPKRGGTVMYPESPSAEVKRPVDLRSSTQHQWPERIVELVRGIGQKEYVAECY